MSEWKTHEEYTAKYGTQEAQAAVQSRAKLVVDGPWLLVRELDGQRVPLDNSIRSTSREIEWLRDQELTRTGVLWTVISFSDFTKTLDFLKTIAYCLDITNCCEGKHMGTKIKLTAKEAKLKEQLDAALIQVEEFKTLAEKQAVQLQDLEETLSKKDVVLEDAFKFLDSTRNQLSKAEVERAQLRQDYNYEIQRRQFAENKLHNAEVRLLSVSSAEQEIDNHKATMQQCGIRIDRHGSAS